MLGLGNIFKERTEDWRMEAGENNLRAVSLIATPLIMAHFVAVMAGAYYGAPQDMYNVLFKTIIGTGAFFCYNLAAGVYRTDCGID